MTSVFRSSHQHCRMFLTAIVPSVIHQTLRKKSFYTFSGLPDRHLDMRSGRNKQKAHDAKTNCPACSKLHPNKVKNNPLKSKLSLVHGHLKCCTSCLVPRPSSSFETQPFCSFPSPATWRNQLLIKESRARLSTWAMHHSSKTQLGHSFV